MTSIFKSSKLLMYLIAFLAVSCATIRFHEDISDYQKDIEKLKLKLKANPEDAEALRDLGVIYFQTQHYAQAESFLQSAFVRSPEDSKTAFYLGMSWEFQNNIPLAQKIYERYNEFSHFTPYRRLMEGRYRRLTRNIIKQEMQELLKLEQEVSTDSLSPNSIAVFPLIYLGQDKEFAPLSKGLSEMLIIDLGQIDGLTVLERIRLQTLQDELALAQSEYVNPNTAPRLGKILGAGNIITGAFNVIGKERIQLNVSFWDVIDGHFPPPSSQADVVANLYYLEKEVVFKVIVEMGIELTQAERDKILRVPTKNFQAFLNYSKGLEKEDTGEFDEAIKYFQSAVKLDPNFEIAVNQAETAESLSLAGGSSEDVLVQVARIEGRPNLPTVSSENFIGNRLQKLGTNLGSNFVPGQDSREPGQDAKEVLILPEPPRPPSKK